jgi:hypothetical protein
MDLKRMILPLEKIRATIGNEFRTEQITHFPKPAKTVSAVWPLTIMDGEQCFNGKTWERFGKM